jgi:hypothetical protein
MKKRSIVISIIVFLLVAGVAFAAFLDKAHILGTSISVGSSEIKLLDDLAGGVVPENLVDSKPGPSFDNIGPDWTADYPVSLFNNGTSLLEIRSFSDYITNNDPDDLRQIIYVEPIQWIDSNGDGLADSSELGINYGRKTIVKWKTEGYILDRILSGSVKAYVLRLSTDSIPDSKQGKSLTFDFVFDAVEIL